MEILPFPWWNLSEYSVVGRPVIAVSKPISTAERWRSHQEHGKISNGGQPKGWAGLVKHVPDQDCSEMRKFSCSRVSIVENDLSISPSFWRPQKKDFLCQALKAHQEKMERREMKQRKARTPSRWHEEVYHDSLALSRKAKRLDSARLSWSLEGMPS